MSFCPSCSLHKRHRFWPWSIQSVPGCSIQKNQDIRSQRVKQKKYFKLIKKKNSNYLKKKVSTLKILFFCGTLTRWIQANAKISLFLVQPGSNRGLMLVSLDTMASSAKKQSNIFSQREATSLLLSDRNLLDFGSQELLLRKCGRGTMISGSMTAACSRIRQDRQSFPWRRMWIEILNWSEFVRSVESYLLYIFIN